MVVENKYKDNFGHIYDLVGNIRFDSNFDFSLIGRLVTETNHNCSSFTNRSEGSYIYQSIENLNVGYKIYKDYKSLKCDTYKDNIMLQNLLSRCEKIKNSKFPQKVLTINNIVIGQEIPFYPNTITLKKYFEEYRNIDVLSIYKKILLILKELFDNGIVYLDTHYENFVIDPLTENINIIDFDYDFILFNETTIDYLKQVLYLYINMINKLSEICGVENIKLSLNDNDNFQKIFNEIDIKKKKKV